MKFTTILFLIVGASAFKIDTQGQCEYEKSGNGDACIKKTTSPCTVPATGVPEVEDCPERTTTELAEKAVFANKTLIDGCDW